mgnify:FL=1
MSEKEYKERIIEAINKIQNLNHLNKIFNYVMKYLVRKSEQ